jgi:hypothetical protein
MSDDIQIIPPKTNDDIEIIEPPSKSKQALKGATAQAARGVLEAVPFVGEKMAGAAGLPEPKTFTERLTRRAATNLPYALAAGATGVGAIPAAAGFVGATGLGQLAEEVGVPKSYQPVAEMVGGGLAPFTRDVSGRMLGYIQPSLEALYKKGKDLGYKLGPSARAEQGMKYGAGADPQANIQNLNKFTKEATARAGNPTESINADWIKKTGGDLGTEVNRLFAGQQFQSNQKFTYDLSKIAHEAEGAAGPGQSIPQRIVISSGGQRRRYAFR